MHILQQLVEEAGYKTRSYSGRNMYGKYCLGVELDDFRTVGELFADILYEVTQGYAARCNGEHYDGLADTFRSMRTDNLGHGTIVYFRDVEYTDPDQNNEDNSNCIEREQE